DRLLDVAAGLGERGLAIHHPRAGALAELFHHLGSDLHRCSPGFSYGETVRTKEKVRSTHVRLTFSRSGRPSGSPDEQVWIETYCRCAASASLSGTLIGIAAAPPSLLAIAISCSCAPEPARLPS